MCFNLPILPNPTLTEGELENWPHLSGVDIPAQQNGTVMLLIGVDYPEVFWTIEGRHGKRGQPYAIKTVLGWSLIRCETRSSSKNFHINFVRKSDELLQKQVECFWKLYNVPEGICGGNGMSRNDHYALQLMENFKKFVDGYNLLPLL